MGIKYISKGEWFDKGTEAKLISKYRSGWGLFEGIRDGKEDEEICTFDEFDMVEENGRKKRKDKSTR